MRYWDDKTGSPVKPTLSQADQYRAAGISPKKGYEPTAQRKVVRPDDRKGSEKRVETLRAALLRPGSPFVDLRSADASV